MRFFIPARAALVTLALAMPLAAQDTGISFGGLRADISLPVEVGADSLTVNQADGSATFSGNVIVAQGDMRLTAALITVRYTADRSAIESLHAEGGVTLSAGSDAATAQSADYMPERGELVLEGEVVLTQGPAAISGQKLVLNLETGLGTMSGRVTTIFTPGND